MKASNKSGLLDANALTPARTASGASVATTVPTSRREAAVCTSLNATGNTRDATTPPTIATIAHLSGWAATS